MVALASDFEIAQELPAQTAARSHGHSCAGFSECAGETGKK
jgi:hypothetical protein